MSAMRFTFLVAAALLLPLTACGADWPTYRGDAARSGYTAEKLPGELSLSWTRRAALPPAGAWPNRPRLRFDRVDEPVVAGGVLYVGGSADEKVYAIDAATGTTRWVFYTEGPVRFAPVAWKGKLYVASDDGYLYCLSAADGRLLWRVLGGPEDKRLLGNERLVGSWPVRGGPVVADDRVYFSAGIWPSEGIYVHAVGAIDGRPAWCNDTVGVPGVRPDVRVGHNRGIAIQGYLAIDGPTLRGPTGMGPAVLDRADGKLLTMIGMGRLPVTGPAPAAGMPQMVVAATDADRRIVIGAARVESLDRKGKATRRVTAGRQLWQAVLPQPALSLIAAGDKVIVGAADNVYLLDAGSGRVTWRATVDGAAFGLAVSDGRLIVSTDKGILHCFDAVGGEAKLVVARPRTPAASGAVYSRSAAEILAKTGAAKGYCVDLGCADGSLAVELAQRSELRIYAIEDTPEKVRAARRRIEQAGLYGRVVVHLADPDRPPYIGRFADLVVSGRSATEGADSVAAAVVARMQSPCFGQGCVGKPGAMRVSKRGPVPGAGNWTHLHADAGNTLCGPDTALRAPLRMFWYKDTDFRQPQRHGWAQRSLFYNGYFVIQGVDGIRTLNAYNGRTLWEHSIKKLALGYDYTGGHSAKLGAPNMCVWNGRVYVRYLDRCVCLDVRTGKKLGEFPLPAKLKGEKQAWWGYLACADGVLIGSVADDAYRIPNFSAGAGLGGLTRIHAQATKLFGLDAMTGQVKWTFAAEHSIGHNAIAMGAGRVYLVDRSANRRATEDHDATGEPDFVAMSKEIATRRGKPKTWWLLLPKLQRGTYPVPPGRAVALDAATGKVLWRTPADVCGNLLIYSAAHDVLVVNGEGRGGADEPGGRMAAYRGTSGERLWRDEFEHEGARPLVNGRTILCEERHPSKGVGRDLLTGKPVATAFTRADLGRYCGPIMSSRTMLAFRAGVIGYFDLTTPTRPARTYNGIRPGCAIELLPAGGLLLMPNAAQGCTCAYMQRATIALWPGEKRAGR